MRNNGSTIRAFGKVRGMRRGAALLITLLLLGFLMTLTLGISALVIREIRLSRSIVDANIAYYSAEAGVEEALWGLHEGKAGVEPNGTYGMTGIKDNFDPDFSYNFTTSNTADSVPGFADNAPIFVEMAGQAGPDGGPGCVLSDGKSSQALAMGKADFYKKCGTATYRKLGVDETHVIPLFSAAGGQTREVTDFLVEYYLRYNKSSDFDPPFQNLPVKYFDVLRWKLYGQPKDGNGVQRTESIADFYPGVDNNGPENPVCMGTDPSLRAVDGSDAESCLMAVKDAARECYLSDAGGAVTGNVPIKAADDNGAGGCTMRDFVSNHKENYLILTNVVNPEVVGLANMKDPSQLPRADIYYRVLSRKGATEPKLVRDYAEIRSQGYAKNGQVVRTLQTKYKAPEILPVFDFALYKTGG